MHGNCTHTCRRLCRPYWNCGRGSAAFGQVMAVASPRLPNDRIEMLPVWCRRMTTILGLWLMRGQCSGISS